MRLATVLPALFLAGGSLESSARAGQNRPPDVRFVDIVDGARIDFRHVRGASGKRYMVETLGSGAALFDYDLDGLLDIYLVNSAPLPGYEGSSSVTNALYRNRGDGTFADVTEAAGIGDPGYGMGAAVGDVDNDGLPDLYLTNFGADVFFRNNGDGTFADRTEAAGLGSELWGASAGFGDIDGDGDLDLYVTNYVDFGLDNHKICHDTAGHQDYCHPDVYNGLADVLYENGGNGTFSDVTEAAGVFTTAGKGLGVVFGDYDNDGDLDIYVANDSVRNFLWRNDGRGHFEDIALAAGAAFNEEGSAEAGMGVDFGDYDNDGYLDIFLSHLDLETNTLYRNSERGFFTDVTFGAGMATPSFFHVGFGTGFFDYDNDGDLDVFVANGHILENVGRRGTKVTYAQANFLMRNDGAGVFENAGPDAGPHFSERQVSRGTSFGDVDNDGDVDLLVANSGDSPNLLRNDGGNRRGQLAIRLVGTKGNRDAVGARLAVRAGGRRQIREVHGAYSYCSHNDLRVIFGLGDEKTVEELEVRWPSGRVESFEGIAADQYLLVKEGAGILGLKPLP